MWKEIIVKKPKKTYKCSLCLNPIIGEHIKGAAVVDGDFHSWREHLSCNTVRNEMCNKCDDNQRCEMSITDCFQEYTHESIPISN